MTHVAIIGAGFSGLATAWFFLQSNHRVTIFDSHPIGGGTSGIAAGLMHPFAGAHAKLNWNGKEGMEASSKLIAIAENALGESVADRCGMLRIAVTEDQKQDFAKCKMGNPEIEWITAEECSKMVPQILPCEGIWIPSAVVVNSSKYLQGLWRACKNLGAVFVQKKIEDLEEFSSYDAIVIAMGAASDKYIPLKSVKGQLIEFEWPQGIPPLPFPVNSHAYMIMNPNGKSCYVGATYEREFNTSEVDIEAAKADLFPKLRLLMPELADSKILSCRAGIRASLPSHLPAIKQIHDRCWVLTGMGSKGLLYHGLFAQKLVNEFRAQFLDLNGPKWT